METFAYRLAKYIKECESGMIHAACELAECSGGNAAVRVEYEEFRDEYQAAVHLAGVIERHSAPTPPARTKGSEN